MKKSQSMQCSKKCFARSVVLNSLVNDNFYTVKNNTLHMSMPKLFFGILEVQFIMWKCLRIVHIRMYIPQTWRKTIKGGWIMCMPYTFNVYLLFRNSNYIFDPYILSIEKQSKRRR